MARTARIVGVPQAARVRVTSGPAAASSRVTLRDSPSSGLLKNAHIRGAWLLCGALFACQGRTEPERATTDTPSPALRVVAASPAEKTLPAPSRSTESPPAATGTSPTEPGPLAATGSTPPAPSSTDHGPLATTAIAGGALVVWTRHDSDENRSDIFLTRLDSAGSPVGASRSLRRTSGEIVDIAVDRRDDDVWVAWQALLAEEPRPRALVAAMRVTADLSRVDAPITLDQYSDENMLAWSDNVAVRVLARPGGDAVVAASGGSVECTDIVTRQQEPCPGFGLFHVGEQGTSTRAAHFGVDGGDPGLGSLVDVGTGAVVDAWAWHGGATIASVYAAHGRPAGEPPFALFECRPPFARGFTGSALVTLCREDHAGPRERCFIAGEPAPEGSCDRVHAVRLDGRRISPKPGARRSDASRVVRCHDGHPVLEVGWTGGGLRLDPQAPGASVDLAEDLGVWTGEYALFIGEDGAVARARCVGADLVAAEPASPLTFAAPVPG